MNAPNATETQCAGSLHRTHLDLFSGIGGFAIVPQVAEEIIRNLQY